MSREVELFVEQRDANYRRCSRLFAILMVVQWGAGVVIAVTLSPYAWEGKAHPIDGHAWVAIFLGGAVSSLPLYLALTRPAAPVTRHVVAVGQMLWSALLIHLAGGRLETHFHIFASLAFLALYRDWRILAPATAVVIADHLVRQLCWPESVFGVADPAWWRFAEHGLWIAVEDVVLIVACRASVEEMRRGARARAEAEALSAREQEKSRQLQRAVDELESSQQTLVRAEKLAAVGQLAASVGHELRNPLAAVRNANAYIAKKVKAGTTAGDPRVIQFGELIEKELDVCGKIIGDLLDFARERPLILAPTPLRDLAEEAIGLIPPSRVPIVNAIAGDLPIPLVDKEQFRQVIMNVAQNAVEAVGERPEPGKVTLRAEKREGNTFRLTVEDDGPGIPEEVVAKMFEPLFTTKVKGTGLGLAIVAGIVKRHQGTIAVQSKVGRGTRFVIDWPTDGARP